MNKRAGREDVEIAGSCGSGRRADGEQRVFPRDDQPLGS